MTTKFYCELRVLDICRQLTKRGSWAGSGTLTSGESLEICVLWLIRQHRLADVAEVRFNQHSLEILIENTLELLKYVGMQLRLDHGRRIVVA